MKGRIITTPNEKGQIVGNIDNEDSYVKILQKTKGMWGNEEHDPHEKKRRAKELTASRRRKDR